MEMLLLKAGTNGPLPTHRDPLFLLHYPFLLERKKGYHPKFSRIVFKLKDSEYEMGSHSVLESSS